MQFQRKSCWVLGFAKSRMEKYLHHFQSYTINLFKMLIINKGFPKNCASWKELLQPALRLLQLLRKISARIPSSKNKIILFYSFLVLGKKKAQAGIFLIITVSPRLTHLTWKAEVQMTNSEQSLKQAQEIKTSLNCPAASLPFNVNYLFCFLLLGQVSGCCK